MKKKIYKKVTLNDFEQKENEKKKKNDTPKDNNPRNMEEFYRRFRHGV